VWTPSSVRSPNLCWLGYYTAGKIEIEQRAYKQKAGMSLFGFGSPTAASKSSPNKNTSATFHLKSVDFEEGDRVVLRGTGKSGIAKYIGEVTGSEDTWVGLELAVPEGNCDGSKDGESYFHCRKNYGIFVPSNLVTKSKQQSIRNSSSKTPSKNSENISMTPDLSSRLLSSASKVTTTPTSKTKANMGTKSIPRSVENADRRRGDHIDPIIADLMNRMENLERGQKESSQALASILTIVQDMHDGNGGSSNTTERVALVKIASLARHAKQSLQ
jgi:dynactin complex subunit